MFTEKELNDLNKADLVELVSDLSDKLDKDLSVTGTKADLVKVILSNQSDDDKSVTANEAHQILEQSEWVAVTALKTVQGANYKVLKGQTATVDGNDVEELLDKKLVVLV